MNYEKLSKKQLLDELKKLSVIEDCHRSSVESAPWGIITHDQTGETKTFNSQLVKITGYTKEEIPDLQSWLRLVHCDNNKHETDPDELYGIAAQGHQQKWGGIISCKDGEKRSCLFLSHLLSSGYRTTLVIDLSEQKLTQDMLDESNTPTSSLVDVLPFGGELIDANGTIIKCNSNTARMLGYKVSELVGKPIVELVDSGSQETFRNNLSQLLSGQSHTSEICMVRKDGSKVNVQRVANPIFSENGEVEAVLATNVNIFEREQVEKTLQESEERYKSIFENNNSVMLLIDPETARIVDANPAAIAFYGWSHEELLSKRITEINTLADNDVFQEMEKAKKCERENFFFQHRLASGEIRDVEVISNPLRLNEEELLFSVIHDITERKTAENKLAESESMMRSTLHSMTELVLVMGPEGEFISCHAPEEALFLPMDQFIGKKSSEVMPPYFNELFCQAMKKISNGETAMFEYYLDFPDERKWYSTRLSPLMHGDEIKGSVAVARDITKRKQAEKVLEQKQKVNDSLINSMPYPIMLIGKDRVVLAANKMALDIGAKVGSYCWKEFGHCDYLSEKDKTRAREAPDTPGIQCTYCRADHMFKTNEMQVDPEVEAFGKLWEIVWIPISENEFLHYTIDISERKQAENILLKTSRMEATATLAAGVAHDFNNLMVGVLGYSELLKVGFKTQPAASDMLDTIGDCARQAGDLAQQLLAYARGGKYQPVKLNLNDIILETLRLNERSFPPRIRIERDFEPQLVEIFADSDQMSQVVTNLCINSVEAIEKNGRILITTRNADLDERFIASHPTLKPGRHVYLSVEDTGDGMDQSTLENIFEPFFSTKFQGRGLGLSAAYGIIKNHDGHISAYSETCVGSTFKIYLPAIELGSQVEPKPTPEKLSESETILVIDDEELVLDVTQRMLSIAGYEVLLAHDGREALDVIKNFDGRIHLAVLDMRMPVMGGPETFPLIRKAKPDMKVIICSGFELDAAAQALLDAGAEAFIQKPFGKVELANNIREILDSDK